MHVGSDTCPQRRGEPGRRPSALRVATTYLAAGLAWACLTDIVLHWASSQVQASAFLLSASKGALFALLSAALVHWLVRREFRGVTQANALLRAVTEGTTDAVFVKDRLGKYLLMNEAAARIVGKPAAEVIGRDDVALFDPDSARLVIARDREVIASGQAETNEDDLSVAGVTRTFLATKSPYRDENGQIIGVVGIARDVTELRRAEEALRNERTLLRTLIDSIPDLIFTKDSQCRFRLCNKALLAFAGVACEADLAGKTVFDLFPPEHARGYHEDDLRALEGETILDREELARDAAGVVTWRTVNKAPLRDHAGAVVGLVGISRNIQNRKERDQALRESEAHLRLFVEHVSAPIAMLDREMRYLHVSRRWLTDFHLGDRDLTGLSHYEVFPETPERWREIHRRGLAGGIERCDEDRFARQDGSAQWIRWEVRPWTAAGQVGGIIIFSEEITARKLAEQASRESEERYRRLVEVLPDAVFIHAEGKIVFCNPACARLMGAASADDLLGRSPFDVAHPDHHDLVRARMAAMGESGQAAAGIEMRVARLDGRAVPVYSVSVPLNDRGRPAFLVALSDLTERERSTDLLRTVMGSVNDAIVTIDRSGTVRSVNPATERLFGYTEAEVVGRDVKMLMPEPVRGEHDRDFVDSVRTGGAKVTGSGREVDARRKDGTRFPAELTVTEFLLDGERHFTGVVRDVTARRQLEAQFRQAQKMEAVGRLAGGVAHDFNNLVTVINGYSDLLLLSFAVGDAKRDQIAEIRDAGERAARLTRQLLAFSRKAIVEPKLLDLNELVGESVRLLRRLIGEDVQLTVVPDPALGRVKADPGQFEQVIMNLVVNARDAMATGGRLTIESRDVTFAQDDRTRPADLPPGRYAQLTVSDTGHGMTEEVKSKLFEPFFTTKGAGKGTGLGLAVVHGVVKQCGGGIGVTSAVGQGTTFELHFPVTPEVLAGQTAGAVRTHAHGSETVLLVEDEQAVRTIARISLEGLGYRVLEAASGAAAVSLADEHSGTIHLLVSDVVMPGMGGRQVAEAVRARRPGVRVLYLSGYTDDAVVRHGVLQAVDALLQKPFTPLVLARKVRAVLDAAAGP